MSSAFLYISNEFSSADECALFFSNILQKKDKIRRIPTRRKRKMMRRKLLQGAKISKIKVSSL